MKKVLIFALSLVSLTTFASPISKEKLASYKKAVDIALQQHDLNCVISPDIFVFTAGSLSRTIDNTTFGEIDDSGAQPVLIFGSDGFIQTSIRVTTSADYKSVVSVYVEARQYATQDINQGTIENPQIVS